MGLLDFITGDDKNNQGAGSNQNPQANQQQMDYSQMDTNGSQPMPNYGQPVTVGQNNNSMAGSIPGAASVPQAQDFSQFGQNTQAGQQVNPNPAQQNPNVNPFGNPQVEPVDPRQNTQPIPNFSVTEENGQTTSVLDSQSNANPDPMQSQQPVDNSTQQSTGQDETIFGNGELSDIYSNNFPQPQNIQPEGVNSSQNGVVDTPMQDPANQNSMDNGNSEQVQEDAMPQNDMQDQSVDQINMDAGAQNSPFGGNQSASMAQDSQQNQFKPFNLQDFKIPSVQDLNLKPNTQQNNADQSVDLNETKTPAAEDQSQPAMANPDAGAPATEVTQEQENIEDMSLGGSMDAEVGSGTSAQIDSSQNISNSIEQTENTSEVSVGGDSTDTNSGDLSAINDLNDGAQESTEISAQDTQTEANSENSNEDLNKEAVQADLIDTSLSSEPTTEVSAGNSENQGSSDQMEQSVSDMSGSQSVDLTVSQEVNQENSEENNNQETENDESNKVSEIESSPTQTDKFMFTKGVLVGLENVAEDYNFNDFVSKMIGKNIDLVLDSKDGGGAKVLQELANQNKKSTSILLKPLHSSDQNVQVGQQEAEDGGVSFVYSNYFEWLRHIAKEARFFVFFESGGLKNLSLMSVLWNISEMYEGSHKPIFLMGEGWSNSLNTLKSTFNISDEDASTLNVVNSPDELMSKLEEMNSQYSSTGTTKIQKVVDRRVEGDEKEFMVY